MVARTKALRCSGFHGVVNDISRSGDSFSNIFVTACARFGSLLSSLHPRSQVVVSSICQTKLADLIVEVAPANVMLRGLASANNWSFICTTGSCWSCIIDLRTHQVRIFRAYFLVRILWV